MNIEGVVTASYIAATILFILALGGLSNQETARRGNWYGIAGMAIALVATILAVQLQTGPVLAQSAELRAAHGRVMQLYSGGRFEEAIVAAEAAVQLGISEFGANHPSTAALISTLADLHTELSHWTDAEQLYRQVANIRSEALSETHPDLAEAYAQLGRTLAEQGEFQAAEDAYWQALQTIELELTRNPHVINRLSLTGGLYRARAWYNRAHRFTHENRLEEADRLYESAIATFEANQWVERSEVAEALYKRAAVLRALGKDNEAMTVEAHAVQLSGGQAGCRLPTVMDC